MRCIVPIVEGPGDMEAAPVLLRKILSEHLRSFDIAVARPKKAGGRSALDRVGGVERFIEYAAITPDCGAILVLVDADDDCATEWARQISVRCNHLGINVPIAIVCAVREYEVWFLASLDSIRGNPIRGSVSFMEDAVYEGDIEALSGVKEWIGHQLPPGRAYKETTDQPSMTALIDVPLAHANSRSFRRLCHAVEELRDAMDAGSATTSPSGP